MQCAGMVHATLVERLCELAMQFTRCERTFYKSLYVQELLHQNKTLEI